MSTEPKLFDPSELLDIFDDFLDPSSLELSIELLDPFDFLRPLEIEVPELLLSFSVPSSERVPESESSEALLELSELELL